MNGYVDLVRCLLRHDAASATINTRDLRGRTALWWASYQGHREVVVLLLEAGADFTLADDRGDTPIGVATDRERFSCIKALEVSPSTIQSPPLLLHHIRLMRR